MIVAEFIKIYCKRKHKVHSKTAWVYNGNLDVDLGFEPPMLCDECSDLLSYSVTRRTYCPHDPKPTCKKYEIHCYKDNYRSRIRKVMRCARAKYQSTLLENCTRAHFLLKKRNQGLRLNNFRAFSLKKLFLVFLLKPSLSNSLIC